MKTLHVCNLANVAYGYCKILDAAGHPVDVRCHDIKHLMSQPEWDDLELDSADFPDEFDFFNNTAEFGDYRRPEWFLAEDVLPPPSKVKRAVKAVLPPAVKNRIRPYYHRMRNGGASIWRRLAPSASVAVGGGNGGGSNGGSPAVKDKANGANGRTDIYKMLRAASEKYDAQWHVGEQALQAYGLHANWMRRHIDDHNVIFAYVLSPIYAMLSPRMPYVSIEIGTMRDIPFDGTDVGKLLALAYRRSDHVLITNPDCNQAAERLGLKNYSFCPHPLDESTYVPTEGESPLRREIVEKYGATTIMFAPARQNWEVKGNDKYFRAFAEFLPTNPKALLMVPAWGQEIERSKNLCTDLGIQSRIAWLDPLSERCMIKYYQASDMVLDQFVLGVFGLITPKSMSCGKPTLTSYDEGVHNWCFEEHPPVVRCSSEKEIFEAMCNLGNSPEKRAEIGRDSRRWVLRHVSKERVTRELIDAAHRAKQNFEARQ